jgi:signal transduction histidine kinase
MYTLKVLAVDDEPNMCAAIHRAMHGYELAIQNFDEPVVYEVETAGSGEEAIQKINDLKPDILLLDYKLPGMSGLDVLDHIEARKDKMVTIMITAFASLDTAVSAIKSGAFDFLAKPFTPAELRKKVSKASESLILARQIERLNAEKRQVRFQFISVLGHELKAPLGAIEGYLLMFKDKSIGNILEDYYPMLDRCLIRVEQMRKLIADLLELTKIESGQRKRELIDINLNDVARMSIETLIPEANHKSITINLPDEPQINMKADREEIEMIFNNLISNAVKYNRQNGKIDISLSKQDSTVQLIVKDTGIGLTKEEAAKLFGEFVRIKNSKTKDILGSGLGLSTLKKIAEMYDGEINVDSQPDEGSTFTMTLKEDSSN